MIDFLTTPWYAYGMLSYTEAKQDLKNRVSLDINVGWVPLVIGLHEAILKLEPKNYQIFQVKEKFGELRFYYSIDTGLQRVADALVAAAVEAASKTCEVCGKAGKLREERAWLLTLCDDDNVDRVIQIETEK